jgi:Zn-dependent protease with chaperone function
LHEHEYAADYISAHVLHNAPGALSALTKWSCEEEEFVPSAEEPDSHPSSKSRIVALHKAT